MLSDKNRNELEIKTCVKLIQEFANTDTTKISAQELFDRANFLIGGFRNTLINIKNRNKIIKDENIQNFSKIEKYFQNLNLKKPYIIIERLDNTNYEAFIEDYDHLFIGKGNTIKDAIGALSDNCRRWYSKKRTLIQKNNIKK